MRVIRIRQRRVKGESETRRWVFRWSRKTRQIKTKTRTKTRKQDG